MLFIVVPAFNEEKNIGRVIGDLFSHGYTNVVVVDDGSSDSTAEAARAAGAMVIQHVVNRGQGAALQTGNEYARAHGANMIVHFDADGQFDVNDITPAVQLLASGQTDVVLGSRFLDDRSQMPWSKRHIVLPVSRIINRVLTGVKLTDAHNGFRVLSRKASENIVILQDKMAHNSEIIRQIRRKNLRVREMPVKILYHHYGQGVRGGFRIILEFLQARFLR